MDRDDEIREADEQEAIALRVAVVRDVLAVIATHVQTHDYGPLATRYLTLDALRAVMDSAMRELLAADHDHARALQVCGETVRQLEAVLWPTPPRVN